MTLLTLCACSWKQFEKNPSGANILLNYDMYLLSISIVKKDLNTFLLNEYLN